MHQSSIFKGIASIALLLLMAAPALASNDIADDHMSQSRRTVRDIQRTTANTASHTVLNAILARNYILHGFNAAPAGATGASGGNGDAGFGVWASGGWQHLNNTSSQWSRGGLGTVIGGFDAKFGDATVGIAVGGEWLRLDMSDSGKYNSDGFSVTPNFSYALLPDLLMDGSVGIGWQNNYRKSSYISSIDGQLHSMDDSFSSWRLFTAAGLTKFWLFDNWVLSGRFGGMYMYNETQSYTLRGTDGFPFSNDLLNVDKNRSNLFQLSLGGRAGYQIGNFCPFVSATYLQDVAKSGRQNDFVGGNFEAGFNYRVGSVSLGLSGVYSVRFQNNTVGGMANVRWDF